MAELNVINRTGLAKSAKIRAFAIEINEDYSKIFTRKDFITALKKASRHLKSRGSEMP